MSCSINGNNWYANLMQQNKNIVVNSNKNTKPSSVWNTENNDAYSHSASDWYKELTKFNEKKLAGINNKPIITYDENGNKIESFYDVNGQTTQANYYDKNGKVKHYDTFNADGSIKNKVDRTNNTDGSYKDTILDANGKKTQDKSYDAAGKLNKSTVYNADNSRVETTYGANGQKTQDKSYDTAGKLNKSTDYNADNSRVETTYDANGKKSKGEEYNSAGQLTSNYIYRQGDKGYGAIDWNNDNKMDGYIANHGDFDNFFTKFGKYWQLPDLEKIVNNSDNSVTDTDKRNSFVSNGIVTAHKISNTKIGFNVTSKDMSRVPGFNYDYAVWDKEKNSYIVGTDKNKDGNLIGDEIKCIVENVGNKACSPLTFDLNGDGVKTSDKLTQYDINGDGKEETINDVADGTLSIRGGNSGKDLFGDNTDLDNDGLSDGFGNGFDALKALAAKEGLIDSKDDMILDSKDIKILEDKYQFGMKTGGYNSSAKSLAALGITEIYLGKTDAVETQNNFDGQNNMLMTQEGSIFAINGIKREYADVWHSLTV